MHVLSLRMWSTNRARCICASYSILNLLEFFVKSHRLELIHRELGLSCSEHLHRLLSRVANQRLSISRVEGSESHRVVTSYREALVHLMRVRRALGDLSSLSRIRHYYCSADLGRLSPSLLRPSSLLRDSNQSLDVFTAEHSCHRQTFTKRLCLPI